MAIYIEEDKNKGGWLGIITIMVIVIIIAVGIYYTFFVKPNIIENIAPAKLKSIDKLFNAQFNPESVVNSNFFKQLNTIVPPQKNLSPAGNSSPFGIF